MKTIGLLGGMSWESTLDYYRQINEGVKKRLGGLHSARLVLYSVDFAPIEDLMRRGDWDGAGAHLAAAARGVEAGGADFLLICTNTLHRVAEAVTAAVSIPLLHIADATADALVADGRKKVGLLGTAFTMEQDFYKGRLAERYDLEVITPEAVDRPRIHEIIFQELCLGQVRPASKAMFLRIVDGLAAKGAEAVILGCTEIGMLIGPADTPVALYDTTRLHAAKAVAWATDGSEAAYA
ncbi:MAG: aspartate/glutamate racemase family protein [Desulfobacteraceae bacterium]|nr:aspartate/glutamate racemase family protein [Desulfobacteraceae bacterium]